MKKCAMNIPKALESIAVGVSYGLIALVTPLVPHIIHGNSLQLTFTETLIFVEISVAVACLASLIHTKFQAIENHLKDLKNFFETEDDDEELGG